MPCLTDRYRAAVRIGATCSNYRSSGRNKDYCCSEKATGILFAENGLPVPGGVYCEPCATGVIQEYKAKLNETWAFERILNGV